jgi:flagellar biosynthesis GTPase FlhF
VHLPLSYLTTGQRVPEDIEIATPERVVDLILNISHWHGTATV